MEMSRVEPRSAAPTELESTPALQYHELPRAPSIDFAEVRHKDPRVSHVSELDRASLSSTATSEAEQTSNGNLSQKFANGIQQSQKPPTPPFNNLAPTYLGKGFAEAPSQHEASREPYISGALQASPKSAGVDEPAAAAGKTPRRGTIERVSIVQSAHVASVSRSLRPAAWTTSEKPELLTSNTYIVVEEEPPEEMRKMWDEKTKRQLNVFLRVLAKGMRESSELITRLCMAYMKGDEKRVAKPVIIITCNTKKYSKMVHKHLSGKPTLACLEAFRVSVTVQTVKFAALFDEDTPGPAPMSLPLVSIGTEIKHKSDHLTYCGRNLRIEVWQDGVGKPSFAKFGGVISIKGRFYGITTAHSFLMDPYRILGWELSDDEDEAVSSASAIATSPSTVSDNDSITDSELSSIADAAQAPERDGEAFESLAYLQPLSKMAYSFQGRTVKPGGTPTRDRSMSDWALFPLQPSVALPNTSATQSLTSVAPESQLKAGSVWILLGNDATCEGYLTSPTASLHTEHALMDVREIMLRSILPKGVSGAWVVRGAEVCGYIVALIGEGLSCLMIPMERTFREIKELFGNDVEFGPELHDRIREHRPVDGVLEPLIAATQRAGEALEEFRENIKLHSGADLSPITALRDPKHQKTTSGPSQKAGLGADSVEAIIPAIKDPLGLDSDEKTDEKIESASTRNLVASVHHIAATCVRLVEAFVGLAERYRFKPSRSLGKAIPRSLFSSADKFARLFTNIAQDLNMMHLTWRCIRDWLLNTAGHSSSYFDIMQRSLSFTHDELDFLSYITRMFTPETQYDARILRISQVIFASKWKATLREAQISVKKLADDAKYLQDQCRLSASQTTPALI